MTVRCSSSVGLPPEARPVALALTALVMSMVGLVLLIACANVANLTACQIIGA